MEETAKPKISVIMPFYNAEGFLDLAITSILNQTLADFEFIIINDASTDNSERIVQKYLSDQRIVYVANETNIGIVKNLNKGLAMAKANIIARMDGDDICDPTRLKKQFEFLQNNPDMAVVGSNIKIIDDHGKEIDLRTKPIDIEFIKKNTLNYMPIVHASGMFRKSALDKVGHYRDEYLYCEDLDLVYRLVFSGYNVTNIPEFLYSYRYHAGSSAHRSRAIAKKVFKLRQETIRQFNLKLNLGQLALVYIQYIVGLIFSARQRQFLEGTYKTIFYHAR